MSEKIKIPRVGDKVILEVFKEIGEKYPVTNIRINAGVGDFIPETLQEAGHPLLKLLYEFNGAAIDTMAITISASLNINFYRGGNQSDKSLVFDDIQLTYSQNGRNQTPHEDRIALVAFLTKRLQAFAPDKTPLSTQLSEHGELQAIHLNTLARLESLAEDVIRKASKTRDELELKHAEKILAIDDELRSKKAELDANHQAESDKLKLKDQELEEKLKVIDDRTNTHARRAIRDKMLTDVQTRINNFGVSGLTAKKRLPVLAGIFFLGGVFFCMLLFNVYELMDYHRTSGVVGLTAKPSRFDLLFGGSSLDDNVKPLSADAASAGRLYFYMLWVRISLMTIGLVATLLFYIKWQSKWAEHHANSEFQLQQFYIDVNRANWVIESGLEWEKEAKSRMPDSLVASLTKNLFLSPTEPDTVLHPADELASALLGSASKLNVKIGDNELVFDRPGKIPKEVAAKKPENS